jgi:hypothetical protein
MRVVWILLLGASLHAATHPLPEPYQSIAGLAYGAPPEFAADALLRLVEYGKLMDRDARRDLIEQAFQLAASAKFPVRMVGLPDTTANTRSGSLSHAYALKLDALSLQSRAVRDMLPIDPLKARELFQDITRPTLAPLTCDDALVFEVSDYYQALSAVVNAAFSFKERSKEEHLNFLLDYLSQATSPAQLAALVPVIQGAGVSPQQREILWSRFNGLLEGLQPDDRSFSASLDTFGSVGAPEMQVSLEKYRQKSHGCESDSGSPNRSKPKTQSDSPATTPKLERYWQSPEAQQLFKAGQNLRFGPQRDLRNEADRASPQWEQQLADYLGQLAGWTPGHEKSEADYYHQKCDVYQSLVELLPPGAQHDEMLEDYVSFISNSSLYLQSPVEWFLGPQALSVRLQSSGQELRKVFDAYLASGNPVLALEARLSQGSGQYTPRGVTSRK